MYQSSNITHTAVVDVSSREVSEKQRPRVICGQRNKTNMSISYGDVLFTTSRNSRNGHFPSVRPSLIDIILNDQVYPTIPAAKSAIFSNLQLSGFAFGDLKINPTDSLTGNTKSIAVCTGGLITVTHGVDTPTVRDGSILIADIHDKSFRTTSPDRNGKCVVIDNDYVRANDRLIIRGMTADSVYENLGEFDIGSVNSSNRVTQSTLEDMRYYVFLFSNEALEIVEKLDEVNNTTNYTEQFGDFVNFITKPNEPDTRYEPNEMLEKTIFSEINNLYAIKYGTYFPPTHKRIMHPRYANLLVSSYHLPTSTGAEVYDKLHREYDRGVLYKSVAVVTKLFSRFLGVAVGNTYEGKLQVSVFSPIMDLLHKFKPH